MSYRVQFKEIGRNKRSWEISCVQPPSDEVLTEEVLRSKALMSRDVQVLTTDDGRAVMYAGMRSVGEILWEVQP
jgi:hypothetical protein